MVDNNLTYAQAGVDIAKGEALVEKIKTRVKATYGPRVLEGVGGFACLYKITEDKLLACGTDGVGTKLKIAQALNKHDTIGIDLVAMCVNDILCTGARPLFFMDYLACGTLDVGVADEIVGGIVDGLNQSNSALIGGETAEMPGMYPDGVYDLAGFAVGEVEHRDLIDGRNITDGDIIIGLSSSGLHSNGFSLFRKLVKEDEKELLLEALTPTRIYRNIISTIQENCRNELKGLAHITGGGYTNIGRVSSLFDYEIDSWPDLSEVPKIYKEVIKRANLSKEELFKTFNMGIGMALVVSPDSKILSLLDSCGEKYWKIGKVRPGKGKIHLRL